MTIALKSKFQHSCARASERLLYRWILQHSLGHVDESVGVEVCAKVQRLFAARNALREVNCDVDQLVSLDSVCA